MAVRVVARLGRVSQRPGTARRRDAYVAAFVERWRDEADSGHRRLASPGLHGVVYADNRLRALVTDDRSEQMFAELLPGGGYGRVDVFDAASDCARLLRATDGWSSERVTAMVLNPARHRPAPELPTTLSLQPVARLANETGVELDQAVTLAALAMPSITNPERFSDHLRSMASESRLFAAVDGSDTVRATCGYALSGSYATVIFVNTDPAWRRRGIGLAMTAHAIAHARASGATVVTLDASNQGQTIYEKLGFEIVDHLTRFRRETA